MLKTIDLFSGAGGLSIGLHAAGFETVAAVEIDPSSVNTFAGHSPNAKIIKSDIRGINLIDFKGNIDLVVGGPPCQPFSTGGLRACQNDDRNMVPSFVKVIDKIRPYAFIMENVPGLAVGNSSNYLNGVLKELNNLGYKITKSIVSAEEYGVPQKRKRLIVVGIRDKYFRFPKPTHGPGTKNYYLTVDDVLPSHVIGEPNKSKITFAKNPDLRPNPHHGLMFNGGGRPIDRSKPSPTILASAGGNKTHFFDELCLVSEYHKHLLAGGAPRIGELPGARRLTIKESAILQTFPPSIEFSGPRSSQYRQIGNAVPPKLAEAIGLALKRQICQEDFIENDYYPIELGFAI